MSDIIQMVESLCKKYENHEFIHGKLRNAIMNLPKQLETSYEKHLNNKQKNEYTTKLINDCIRGFFSSHLFFYHHNNNQDTFVLYDKDTFDILNNNDFSVHIYDYINKLGNTDLIYKFKYRIEVSITNSVKTQLLLEAIPTSCTIQKVIALFYPVSIEKREVVKIFLTMLGNNILKKSDNLNFLTSSLNKSYLNYLTILIGDILGQYDYLQNVKFKYTGQDNIHFLRANLINIETIRSYIMDIIVVACHYSTRFQLKPFITKCTSQTKKILRKFNSVEIIYGDFLQKFTTKKNESIICKKDLMFLWSLYSYEELLPQIHSEKHVFDYFLSKLSYENGSFIDISSDILEEVKQFVSFMNKSFLKCQEFELDEFEMDEVITIFCDIEKEELNYMTPEIAVQSIKYYVENLNIHNNKICNISCVYWGKKQEVEEFIHDYLNLSNDMASSYNAYKLYSTSKYTYKVNKSYFDVLYNDIAV